MSKLPKFNIPGQIHFVTAKVQSGIPLFLAHDFCEILCANLNYYREKHDYKLIGYVIMPDHVHALIQPTNDSRIQRIVQDVKRYSAKQIRERLVTDPITWDNMGGLIVPYIKLSSLNQAKGYRCKQSLQVPKLGDFCVSNPRTDKHKHQFWQRGFYDFNIYSEEKLIEKLNYIHANPVRWGMVDQPGEYEYSSYRNYYIDGGDFPLSVDWL